MRTVAFRSLLRACPLVFSLPLLGLMTGCAGSRGGAKAEGFGSSSNVVTLAAVSTKHDDDSGKPVRRARSNRSSIVRVSNDSEDGTRRSLGAAPVQPPSDWKIEKVSALVEKGSYVGLTSGRLRFQPANLNPNAPTPALLEDAVIGSTVQGKLINEGQMEPGTFEVKSRGGVVQIRPTNGSTATMKVAKAINFALAVPGVREVQVEIPQPPPEAPTTAANVTQGSKRPTPLP